MEQQGEGRILRPSPCYKEGCCLNLQEILEYFAMMADLEEEERSRYLPLCSAAADDLQLQLLHPPDTDEQCRRVNRAAASLAFSRYCVIRSCAEGGDSYQVGDVRVANGKGAGAQEAYQCWRQARASLAGLLKDEEFVFSRVGL